MGLIDMGLDRNVLFTSNGKGDYLDKQKANRYNYNDVFCKGNLVPMSKRGVY